MKLLYDYRIFSLQTYGGISRYFYELIKSILDISDEDIEQIYLFEGFYLCNFDLKNLKNKTLNYFGIKRPKIKKTKKIFEQINKLFFSYYLKKNKIGLQNNLIYHSTYYGYSELNYLKKAKVVYTVYDMTHERFPEVFIKSLKVINDKKRSLEKADRIICISNFTKKDLIEITDIDPKKVDVVYLGTNLNRLNPENLVNLDKYKPYILFIGNKQGYKNFNILLECFILEKLYKDFNLVCFGGENFSSEVSNKILKYNLKNRIFQIGGDDNLLASFYKNAFCLVYPSEYEGFGLPILEAISLGCPVISSNTSSLPEVGREAVLYFNPLDRKELLHNIGILDNDAALRKNLIQKGFEQAKNFSWEQTALETIGVYKKT